MNKIDKILKIKAERVSSWIWGRETPQRFLSTSAIPQGSYCRSIMVRNSVTTLCHTDHPHPPFLAQRSTPMSFHVEVLVPNLRSLDFDWSACMCFLSCLSYSHFYFSFRDSYLRFASSALCCLWTLMSKSYF